jgi:predicted SprT family Zn-dependent metalloprotease
MAKPTAQAYAELQKAYDHFNRELFEGTLPDCLLTLQREKDTYGYFSRNRFISSAGEKIDEIALNPSYFAVQPLVEILQTIAHEMVHLWQAHFGKPGRVRYHNGEFAAKMEAIGLMPSSTGQRVGGAPVTAWRTTPLRAGVSCRLVKRW